MTFCVLTLGIGANFLDVQRTDGHTDVEVEIFIQMSYNPSSKKVKYARKAIQISTGI